MSATRGTRTVGRTATCGPDASSNESVSTLHAGVAGCAVAAAQTVPVDEVAEPLSQALAPRGGP